jgi:hypothetical protein
MAKALEARTKVAAKKLLKLFGPKGQHWVSGYSALAADGTPTNETGKEAVRWCLSGAIMKLRIGKSVFQELETRLVERGGILEFNDSKNTYTHVRRFLEKTAGIKRTKKAVKK